MNLKYYLRGLGIGIVITAVIMGIVTAGKIKPLTNEEIIAKAKDLGMVEETVLNDRVEKAKADTKEQLREELETEIEASMREKLTAEMVAEAEPEEQPKPLEFTVRKGETPYSIGERLEKEGFVTTASDFDKYLIENGYDRKIVASQYQIPADADMETIARMITGEKITE